MVEIDISKNHRAEALKRATRANELLDEICKSMLALSYLWDEVQNHYYEDKLYEGMEDALCAGYPFEDSFDEVVRRVLVWNETVAENLDKTFEEV